MKFTYILAIAALAITVSGCSGNAPTTAAATTPAATSKSPTPTPTPTEMSVAEAGKYYLAVICKSNKAGQAMGSAVEKQPFDFAAAHKATAAYRDALRTAIQQLSAPKMKWPATASKDVDTFVEDLYGELGKAANTAQAGNEANFIQAWNAWPAPSLEASQRVRLKLNLPADAKASCKM